MKCNHCGAEIADDSTFCEHCGKKVTINKTTKPSKPWWKRKWVIITGSIVVLAAIIITIICIRLNGQNKFIRSCMNYYESQPIVKSDYNKGGGGGALCRNYWGKGQYFLHHDDVLGNTIVRMKSSSSKRHDNIVIFSDYFQVIFNKVEYSEPFVFATNDGTGEVKYYLLSDGDVREVGTGDLDHLWGMGYDRYNGYAYNYDRYAEDGSIRCDDSTIFACGLQPVKKNGKWGYIDTCGNEVIQCKFEHAYPFEYGMAVVAQYDNTTDDRPAWYLIDHNGNQLFFMGHSSFPEEFLGFCADGKRQFFSYGLMPVIKGGKYGYINRTGEVAIPYRYNSARPFCYGLAVVSEQLPGRDEEDFMFIDKDNDIVIPDARPSLRAASDFSNATGTVGAFVWDFFGRRYFIDRKTMQWIEK